MLPAEIFTQHAKCSLKYLICRIYWQRAVFIHKGWSLPSTFTLMCNNKCLNANCLHIHTVWSEPSIFEQQHEKMYLWTYALNKDSNQLALPNSLISLHCPVETLHPWSSRMCTVMILIRLHKYAGWSESTLGPHIQRYILCCYGSFVGIFFCIQWLCKLATKTLTPQL